MYNQLSIFTTHSDKRPYCYNRKQKRGIYNKVQIYMHWLSCYSVSVDAEAESLTLFQYQFSCANIFICVNIYTVDTNLNISNVSGDTVLRQIKADPSDSPWSFRKIN